MAKAKHDWAKLDPRIDTLKAQGWNDTQIAKELNIGRQTLVDHLRACESVHLGTPETTEVIEVPQETPEHPGTLEGYQKVIEEIQQSVPEVAHLVTDEGHLSTPEVHPEVSVEDSSTAHSGVPARQELGGNPLVGHPGTPTAEDWELWAVIKTRWSEVEKLLTDRQALVGPLTGTPGHTRKKTYVFDVRHIALIDRYAQEHHLDLKEVMFLALEEFFQRRGYPNA
jgi:Bacterial regulatory protein, Fis family